MFVKNRKRVQPQDFLPNFIYMNTNRGLGQAAKLLLCLQLIQVLARNYGQCMCFLLQTACRPSFIIPHFNISLACDDTLMLSSGEHLAFQYRQNWTANKTVLFGVASKPSPKQILAGHMSIQTLS